MSTTALDAIDKKTPAEATVIAPQKTAEEIAKDRKSLEAFCDI